MGNTNTKDVPQNITTHIVPFYDALLADPDVVIQVLAEHMSQDNKTHVIACCLNMPTIEKQQKLQNLKDLPLITEKSTDPEIQSVLNTWASQFRASQFRPIQFKLHEYYFI